MCGIAGVIGERDFGAAQAVLDRMLSAIAHRGPDGQGTYVTACTNGALAMGMRRLAIVDIAGGNQPIATPQGQQIVMNGEIYNYRAIRDALAARGYVFRTQSDTEVAVAGYMVQGLDQALHSWQGMFALAIYDPVRGLLHLVRDRFGKKPLYYTKKDDRFWFASEIKSLLAGLGQAPDLNLQAVEDYRAFRYVPEPETIWQGIYKLPPGHILTLDLHRLSFSVESYWRPSVVSAGADMSDALPHFTSLFHKAVEKRLLSSDVPVGILLSGGLDSSAVAVAAREVGHQAIRSYSVHFDHPAAFNEKPYAEQVAHHAGMHHHSLMMSVDDFRSDMSRLVEMTDEPLADLATIPLYRICRYAQTDVKVLLSGEGSDEMLAGYHYDQLARKYDRLRLISRFVPRAVLSKMPQDILRRMARTGWSGLARDIASDPTLGGRTVPRAVKRVQEAYDACSSPELIDQMQQVMMGGWLVEDLLMKADKASMAASVELRCPFLDHELAEFCMRLPLSWKVGNFAHGYTTKKILRDYARTRLPSEIINRSKQGFPVPAAHWLRHDLSSWARDAIMSSGLDFAVSATMREKMWRDFMDGQSALSDDLWRLVVLSLWQQRWMASS